MYFDEDVILDLRLNILNPFIDYFVIVESTFNHKGEKRKLKFDINKYKKFENKIIYLIFDKEPSGIEKVFDTDNEGEVSRKLILNAASRENGQRNFISKGLERANEKDLILISDVDEIPNLEKINWNTLKDQIVLFKQDMFYYKLNLRLPDLIWSGSKACRKKYLKSPQWLRNVKDKKYSFFRLDTLFSEKKYINIKFINNGGWHFSNIKTAAEIEYKLKSYLHHREFDLNPISESEIEDIIKNKQAIYDLKVDKKINKIGSGNKLVEHPLNKLPSYILENIDKYKDWIN
jgi:beta-1,4-mannosyl-glycoprotein beta-1,4-N-acetylglucosaminyltransferase|tara:strand:+ start:1231 stop:2100 length:870 start_codon:yes stop_codon:yes gene_type:complete